MEKVSVGLIRVSGVGGLTIVFFACLHLQIAAIKNKVKISPLLTSSVINHIIYILYGIVNCKALERGPMRCMHNN